MLKGRLAFIPRERFAVGDRRIEVVRKQHRGGNQWAGDRPDAAFVETRDERMKWSVVELARARRQRERWHGLQQGRGNGAHLETRGRFLGQAAQPLQPGFHACVGLRVEAQGRRARHTEHIQRLFEVGRCQALGRIHADHVRQQVRVLRVLHRRRVAGQDGKGLRCRAVRKIGRDAGCVAAGHVGGHAFHLQVELLQDGGGNAAARYVDRKPSAFATAAARAKR